MSGTESIFPLSSNALAIAMLILFVLFLSFVYVCHYEFENFKESIRSNLINPTKEPKVIKTDDRTIHSNRRNEESYSSDLKSINSNLAEIASHLKVLSTKETSKIPEVKDDKEEEVENKVSQNLFVGYSNEIHPSQPFQPSKFQTLNGDKKRIFKLQSNNNIEYEFTLTSYGLDSSRITEVVVGNDHLIESLDTIHFNISGHEQIAGIFKVTDGRITDIIRKLKVKG